MKIKDKLVLVSIVGIGLSTCFAGYLGVHGYPTQDAHYAFGVDTGAKDKWDSTKSIEPPLGPGKAIQIATKFVKTVPVRGDMKAWSLKDIKLIKMSNSSLTRLPVGPEEWIYVAHFDGDPGPRGWNGLLPWIEVPVRLDGTVPQPTITKP